MVNAWWFCSWPELKELGVQSHNHVRVDAVFPLTSDLWCRVVERVQVIDENVELPVGDVLPFVLDHHSAQLIDRIPFRQQKLTTHDND